MKTEKSEKLFQMIGEIDEDIVAEAEKIPVTATNVISFPSNRSRRIFGILVASVVFVMVGVIGISGLFNMGSNDDWSEGDFAAESPVPEVAVPEADSEEDELGVGEAFVDVYEEMTLEEAYLIPVLGSYLPRWIPDGFEASDVRKYMEPEEKLSLFMWGYGAHIDWLIQMEMPLNDENETFLLSEMTLDALIQIAEYIEEDVEYDWSGEDEGGSGEYVWTGWVMSFNMIDDGVLIQVNMRGVEPQDAWEVIQSIKN